ncbi:SDR family NAD(P)-dependent oxidoreductase [Acidisphaera sp. S103]|uniref:SDR family NAD(P)-dependent oxidoreductase n=1 Tax=Acidisphaera sp. S103 TaxID=1747223 RepID=UPI00131C3F28|nr:SDR family NAD(P)-dependent oxidoreductase [Acidisphaera sp. S103]
MRFEGKIALITAAANGIGRATAAIMAAEGATVVCVDNHPERLGSAVAALGKQAHGRLCDALDQGQVDAVVADVVREFGRIDILVNAVGGSTIIAKPSATVEEHSLDDWQRVIKFNLDGTFLFTHAIVPIMKGQKAGKIVNLASIAGRGMSVASGVAYAAAKGGIIALTRKLSFELGPFGININAIAPSLTLTERIRPHWNQRSPEAQAAQVEATPLRRVAEASDQAKVICFLASSDADFVTGLTIDVTGGQSG